MPKNPYLFEFAPPPLTQAHQLSKIIEVSPMAKKVYAKIVEKLKSGEVQLIPSSHELPETMRTVNLTFEELGSPEVIYNKEIHQVIVMAQHEFGLIDWRGGGGIVHLQIDLDYERWLELHD